MAMNSQTNSYTTDTSEEAERIQSDLLRALSPQERIQKMCILSTSLRRMAFDAIRRFHPTLNDNEVRLKFIESTYGIELANSVRSHLELNQID
jgi:hypothetical protein